MLFSVHRRARHRGGKRPVLSSRSLTVCLQSWSAEATGKRQRRRGMYQWTLEGSLVQKLSRLPRFLQLPRVICDSQMEIKTSSRITRFGRCRSVPASTLKRTAHGEPSPGNAMTFLSDRMESTEPSKPNTIPALSGKEAICLLRLFSANQNQSRWTKHCGRASYSAMDITHGSSL